MGIAITSARRAEDLVCTHDKGNIKNQHRRFIRINQDV